MANAADDIEKFCENFQNKLPYTTNYIFRTKTLFHCCHFQGPLSS